MLDPRPQRRSAASRRRRPPHHAALARAARMGRPCRIRAGLRPVRQRHRRRASRLGRLPSCSAMSRLRRSCPPPWLPLIPAVTLAALGWVRRSDAATLAAAGLALCWAAWPFLQWLALNGGALLGIWARVSDLPAPAAMATRLLAPALAGALVLWRHPPTMVRLREAGWITVALVGTDLRAHRLEAAVRDHHRRPLRRARAGGADALGGAARGRRRRDLAPLAARRARVRPRQPRPFRLVHAAPARSAMGQAGGRRATRRQSASPRLGAGLRAALGGGTPPAAAPRARGAGARLGTDAARPNARRRRASPD